MRRWGVRQACVLAAQAGLASSWGAPQCPHYLGSLRPGKDLQTCSVCVELWAFHARTTRGMPLPNRAGLAGAAHTCCIHASCAAAGRYEDCERYFRQMQSGGCCPELAGWLPRSPPQIPSPPALDAAPHSRAAPPSCPASRAQNARCLPMQRAGLPTGSALPSCLTPCCTGGLRTGRAASSCCAA